MFTGIVEKTGKIVHIEQDKTNYNFTIEVDFANELTIDQSLAHDGCCLTVVKLIGNKKQYVVTAMNETMMKTNMKSWYIGYEVNLERSMKLDARIDGHIVQGHVDQTAVCQDVVDENGSWRYYFTYDIEQKNITVPKGSICVNGVSLTVVDSEKGSFSVAIIPYTQEITNFHNFRKGTIVNIEFDIFGKYVQRLLEEYFSMTK